MTSDGVYFKAWRLRLIQSFCDLQYTTIFRAAIVLGCPRKKSSEHDVFGAFALYFLCVSLCTGLFSAFFQALIGFDCRRIVLRQIKP